MRAPGNRRRLARSAAGAALVLLLASAAFLAWPEVERLNGARPELVDRPHGVAALEGMTAALGVAHNAGNRPDTLASAARAGADVVEVDVIEVDGSLRAGRPHPWPAFADRLLHGPSLDRVWRDSAAVPALKLDLKESSTGFVDRIARFVAPRSAQRRVMVASRSPAVLDSLRDQAPGAVRLLSVTDADELARVGTDTGALAAVQGLSVHHRLLDTATVQRLDVDGWLLLAWTVNEPRRAADLISAGVDGITTDNLAVLRALRDR